MPDLPMPPGRAEARRRARWQEIGAAPATLGPPARRQATRWKVTVPALAAGAAAAVFAAFAFAGQPAGRISLTASWTAVPSPVSRSVGAAAEQRCQSRLLAQHWPVSVQAMTGVLAERRGQLTAVMLSGAGQYGMCIGNHGTLLFSGIGAAGRFQPANGLVLDGEPGKLNGSDPFRLAYGQVTPSVTRVVIDTADGWHVDATVAGGRFFAWWPSGADPAAVTGYTSGGRAVATVHPPRVRLPASPVRGPATP